jgi:hypothetical protein
MGAAAGRPPSRFTRVISISVYDAAGRRAFGADILFVLNGALLGHATLGFAPSTLSLPTGDATVNIVAIYGGSSQAVSTQLGLDDYAIRFPFGTVAGYAAANPVAKCPDGTVGHPCVDCDSPLGKIRICV